MLPLTEDRAMELLQRCFGDLSHAYCWEAIENIEWSGESSGTEVLVDDVYNVVFDPNGWTMASRIAAARYFGREDSPLGYRLTRVEILDMVRQPWIANADFYVIDCDGSLRAMRTHEDPDSQYGFWIPTKDV